MNRFIAILCLSLFYVLDTQGQNSPDDVLGVWKNGEGTAMIKIAKTGNEYLGKIVWLKEPNDPLNGKPKVDKNNSDVTKKNVPIVGINLLKDLKFKNDHWEDGTIYDPENGKTYKCIIKFRDGKLNLRGYIGTSLLGRTQNWTKVADIK
jgi:uncharacterized protein (DUF2147 family)